MLEIKIWNYPEYPIKREEARLKNLDWWERNKSKLTIHDPLFADLSSRKID